MDKITTLLGTPIWWFTAIFVGLLVNIASAYAKPLLDKLLSSLSTAWRNRTEKSAEKYRNEINHLKSTPEALIALAENEFRKRQRAIFILVLASMSFILFIQLLFAFAGTPKGGQLKLFIHFFEGYVVVLFAWATLLYSEASNLGDKVTTAREELAREKAGTSKNSTNNSYNE